MVPGLQRGPERHSAISLDALVLIMVTGLTLHLDSFKHTIYTTPTLNAAAVGLLCLYLVLDLLGQPLVNSTTRRRSLYYGGKSAILTGLIALIVLWPTLNMIGLRHATHPWMYVHDTSINVEEATKFLLAGKDPYAQTYFHTPLARFPWDADGHYGTPNPALWMTDTFPGQELLTVPFLVAAQATLGWFDERFIYLLAFAATMVLLLRLAPSPTTRLALVAGVALNPLWISTFIYGQNDILVLVEILAVLWLSLRGRWRLALLALAIGCATKQTTLLMVPFYLWWLALQLGITWQDRAARLLRLLPWLVVPFALMIGPFALWNWRAFYDGNFGYVAGTVVHSYPMQGFDGLGVASFILWSHVVPGPNAYYPFWVLEAGVALPLTALLLRRMHGDVAITVMLGAYATVLFAIFYFSRFFHQSYAAFTIDLLLVAYLAHRPARRPADDGHLSFDVIVPLLLVPQLIDPPTIQVNGILASLAFGLLLTYVVVAALAPWGRLGHSIARRYATAARALVLTSLAYVTIFAPGFNSITDRLRWNAGALLHDTALQIQISAGALLRGGNPYTMSFWNTPLRPSYIGDVTKAGSSQDLPLTHNPHLPLEFLLGAPLQGLFNALNLLFDERYLYLFALIGLALALALLLKTSGRQLALLGAVLFSPLFARALLAGQDDILVLLAVVLALLLLGAGRYGTGVFVLGVACALKLTAWPLIPLVIAYLCGIDRYRSHPRSLLLRWLGRAVSFCAPLALSALPFINLNARAFWDDAFGYMLGFAHNAVPLDLTWGSGFRALGFGRIASSLGWAHLDGSGYIGPYLAIAGGTGIAAAIALRLWRTPSPSLLIGGYLVLLFVLEYFGRFMVDTSLGYLIVLAPLAFYLPADLALARPAPVPLPMPDTEPTAIVAYAR